VDENRVLCAAGGISVARFFRTRDRGPRTDRPQNIDRMPSSEANKGDPAPSLLAERQAPDGDNSETGSF